MIEFKLEDFNINPEKKGTAYLFDIDLIERSAYPNFPKLPNHALMKFSSYFKELGYKIILVYSANRIPLRYQEG